MDTKQAYIFDFDGVLVTTMEAHFHCYAEACAECGVTVEKAQFYRQAGMSGIEQISYFADKDGKDVDVQAIYRRKTELYPKYRDLATIIEPNYTLLCCLHAQGVKVAIASGSSPGSIVPLIERFQIPCDALVTARDVARGKPNPDLFLKAAERLGVAPENCTVLEDSEAGVEAAKRAEMSVMRFYGKE